MNDASLVEHINALVDEEQRLLGQVDRPESQTDRIHAIEVELDQCWDLLRQRRARRDAGLNPDDAQVRDASTVERYLN